MSLWKALITGFIIVLVLGLLKEGVEFFKNFSDLNGDFRAYSEVGLMCLLLGFGLYIGENVTYWLKRWLKGLDFSHDRQSINGGRIESHYR